MDQKKPLRPHKCLQINSCFILPLFPHLPRVPLIFPSISPSPVPMSPCVQEPTLHIFLTLKPITSLQNSVQLEKPCQQPLLMQFSLISSFLPFTRSFLLQKPLFSSVPFLLNSNYLQLIWRLLTSPSGQPKLWKWLPASEGKENRCIRREIPPSGAHSCPLQTSSSGGCIQRRYLAFNSPERFFSSWYLSNCFSSSNKISHTKSSGKKFCSLTRSYKNCSISLLSNCTYMLCLVLFNCY